MATSGHRNIANVRQRVRQIVLESDTRGGRLYNLVIFGAILLSVIGLLFEPRPLASVAFEQAPLWVQVIEAASLVVFLADLLLHLFASQRPWVYLRSFYGLIDLLAVLFFFVPQINSGLLLWVFKFGRILRVFKLLRFMDEARYLGSALRASARRIAVFIFFVVITQVVLGYLMVLLESVHPDSQFTTVGDGVYWAVVTMTTVGYGDYVPQTLLGRGLAVVVMLLGFGIIAIPTGIVTYEGVRQAQADRRSCPACGRQGHRQQAIYCDQCGSALFPSAGVEGRMS